MWKSIELRRDKTYVVGWNNNVPLLVPIPHSLLASSFVWVCLTNSAQTPFAGVFDPQRGAIKDRLVGPSVTAGIESVALLGRSVVAVDRQHVCFFPDL